MKDLQGVVGTSISGTFLPTHLVPAFLRTLRKVDPDAALTILDKHFYRGALLLLPARVREDATPEQVTELLEDLTDKLERAAPKGYRWGTAQGNDSAFGYWPKIDTTEPFATFTIQTWHADGSTSRVAGNLPQDVLAVLDGTLDNCPFIEIRAVALHNPKELER